MKNYKVWIGVNDLAREGRLRATNGGALTWTKWARDQPNNAHKVNNQYYAVFLEDSSARGWNDAPVSNKYVFLCMYEI